jgi:hypothetical protein
MSSTLIVAHHHTFSTLFYLEAICRPTAPRPHRQAALRDNAGINHRLPAGRHLIEAANIHLAILSQRGACAGSKVAVIARVCGVRLPCSRQH